MRSARFESRGAAQAWVDRQGAPPLLQRPILSGAEGRAVLAATRDDPLVHASAALMLLAGLRPQEVSELQVRDYVLGERRLHVGSVRRPRIIRIAPSAAAAVDAYLEGQDADPGEPLLVGLQGVKVVTLFSAAMRAAGLDVRAHDLRRSAMAAVLEDGAPVQHLEAYFGITKSASRKDLVPVREGYDEGIAAVLEAEFAG
ncbi:tyrosine-type recombinase/integrase [Streptomyces sp. NBC_01456]|uniref:tyrosine-type recombinase/integrase n=1 Tax=Streptomyces sp. NBC_01456 TaxID=2975868 RepID=UPI002E313C21|nr:tyrosine-type recombinase/integrase [Streptomyces sp. NBC_01456]